MSATNLKRSCSELRSTKKHTYSFYANCLCQVLEDPCTETPRVNGYSSSGYFTGESLAMIKLHWAWAMFLWIATYFTRVRKSLYSGALGKVTELLFFPLFRLGFGCRCLYYRLVYWNCYCSMSRKTFVHNYLLYWRPKCVICPFLIHRM
jgi:hypothetical protein